MGDKDNPVLPTEQRINDLLTAASATNTPEVLQKVQQAAAEYQFRRQFGRAPEPQETGIVSELQRKAVTEGLSHHRCAPARDRDRNPRPHRQGAAGRSARPHRRRAGRDRQIPPPAPLNIGNQNAFRPACRFARAMGGHRHPDLRDRADAGPDHREAGQVRAALDAADPAGKARIYSDIVAATSGGTRAATLAKLGAKGVDGMVEAYAGAMTGLDPAIGESIIRGQAAMKIKDAYNPMKDGNKDESNARSTNTSRPARSRWRPAPTRRAPIAVMRGAVMARVADLAATDPNFKGKFTDALIQRAVNDVTGGIVTAQWRR
jgi:hypothetical protein